MPISFMIDTGGALQVTAQPGVAQGGTPEALQPKVRFAMSLPDSYGGNVTFSGTVAAVVGNALQTAVALTGSPIALPAVPGSGTTFWALQVCVNAANGTVGVVTMLTSSSGPPTASAGNVILMQSQTKASDAIPWSSGVAAITSLGTAPTFTMLS